MTSVREMTELPDEDHEILAQVAAAQEADTIERALTAARERLGMDAAYISHVDSERQRIDELSGDGSDIGFDTGTEIPIDETYCSKMLKGELPNMIRDTSDEPSARDLGATKRIGSYVGVAITLADGSVHGTLCCASSEPREQLGEEELAFMRVLAGMVAARIDRVKSDLG